MNIAVADEGGNLVAHVRMDGAWMGSAHISINTAWTARAFEIAAKDLAGHPQCGEPLFGIHASNGGMVMIFAGGIPLVKNGSVVGAIGVSNRIRYGYRKRRIALFAARGVSGWALRRSPPTLYDKAALAFFAHLGSRGMRRLYSQLQNSLAALSALCLVLFLLPCAAKARTHTHHAHRAHPVRVHARRRHHVHPHTARALRRARHHGTRAVQEAVREETARVAREEDTDVNTATVPELPLAAMHLPPMRGSHESLVRQNTRAEQEGILRIRDDQDLLTLRQQGKLVALPKSAALRVDPRLPANRRYCRVWVSRFLANLSRAHYERFHRPLQVNSAARTIAFQEHLRHINGNAAPAEGDVASPHLTGEAVDLAKKGLSPSEVAWMRAYLLPLQSAGKIDVEEEFKQSCFHISVYQSYLPKHDPASHSAELMASGMH